MRIFLEAGFRFWPGQDLTGPIQMTPLNLLLPLNSHSCCYHIPQGLSKLGIFFASSSFLPIWICSIPKASRFISQIFFCTVFSFSPLLPPGPYFKSPASLLQTDYSPVAAFPTLIFTILPEGSIQNASLTVVPQWPYDQVAESLAHNLQSPPWRVPGHLPSCALDTSTSLSMAAL